MNLFINILLVVSSDHGRGKGLIVDHSFAAVVGVVDRTGTAGRHAHRIIIFIIINIICPRARRKSRKSEPASKVPIQTPNLSQTVR